MDDFVDHVIDQLDDTQVHARRMFGGHGLYHDTHFFGIIAKGALYFKVDDVTKKRYQEKGMKPFHPFGMHEMRNYWEVPADVFEDREMLRVWGEEAWKLAPQKKRK